MARCLRRNLGPIGHLEPSEYTKETATGIPAVSCPACGNVSDLECEVSSVGVVAKEWHCPWPMCGFRSWLTLESFAEEVLR